VRARDLGSFCGLAQASYLALPLARCWLRAPYDDLELRRGWSGETRLSRQSLSDIREFTQLRNSRHVGRSIWLRPDTATGHVDAGPLGWGGQINESRVQLPAYGFWSAEEAAVHITWRELRAVRLYVLWYLETLRGRRLLLFEDNQAVVAILTNLTSKSPALMRELRLLVEVLDWNDISIRALYIRSAENKIADYFSRIARARDYRIVASIFELAQSWWGPCTVDAFASTASALLPRFWSDVPTPAGRPRPPTPSPRCGRASESGPTLGLPPLYSRSLCSCFVRSQARRRWCAHRTGRERRGSRSCRISRPRWRTFLQARCRGSLSTHRRG